MVIALQRRILLIFLLIFLVNSCLDPTESNGHCTKCLATQNLQSGSCYTKLRGCLKQSAILCLQCQDGYILSNNNCVREGQYYNLTTLDPAPVKIEQTKLNASQITSVLVGGFKDTTNFNSTFYLQARTTLYKQYPNLAGFKIYKVEEQIVNGQNYQFYIINTDNYDLYLAKVYVTFQLQASVTEIYKNDVSILKNSIPVQGSQPLPGVWRPFTDISDQRYADSLNLIQKTFTGIDTYKLQKVEYQIVAGINFLFYYISSKGQSFTIQIYKPFYGPGVTKNVWGVKPSVSNSSTSTTDQQTNPISGGSDIMPISEYNNEPFLSVIKVIQKIFPTFSIQSIKKVQRQIVAGWNLIVTFSLQNSTDAYEAQIFVPLAYTGNPPQVQSMKKNEVSYNFTTNNQSISPSTLSDSSNSSSISISPLVGGYSDVINFNNPFYVQAKSVLFKEYPQLSNITLVKSQQQIVNGQNFIFYFLNQQRADQYLAQVYITLQLNVTINKIYKNSESIKTGDQANVDLTTPLQGAWATYDNLTNQNFLKAQNVVTQTYPGLTNYKLTQVEYQIVAGTNYRLFFINQASGDTFTAQVYLPFNAQPELTSTWGVEPVSQPVLTPVNSSTTDTNTGSHQTILPSEYNSEPFLTAKIAIQKVFPNFTQSLVSKAEKQIVAGQNVYITFSYASSSDIYDIVVFIPLAYTGKAASLTSINKNGVLYNPSQIPTTSNNASTITTNTTQNQTVLVAGGYQTTSDFSSALFIQANKTLLKEYPQLLNFTIKKVQNQIVNGMNYVFTIVDTKTNDEYIVRVYVTLSKKASVQQILKNKISIKKQTQSNNSTSIPVTNTSTTSNISLSTPNTQSIDDLISGGWQQVASTQYKYELFISVQATIVKVFPTFKTQLIKQIAKQLVAGWNYIVSFILPNSTDLYQVKVFVPLSYTGDAPSISQMKKNNVIYDPTATKIASSYSYQSDPVFTQLYKFFKNQINISNLLPIAQVQRQLKSFANSSANYYEYKIIYSSDEYSICRYYPDYGVYQIISYIADKTQLYHLVDKLGLTVTDRTQSVLVQKIKQYDSKRFNRILISNITQIKLSDYFRVYRISGYAYLGHFNISILDKGQLFVIQTSLIDNKTCFQIRTNVTVQFRQQYIIDQLKIFLFSKYSLSGYQLTLAQANAHDNITTQYVILLVRDDLKKLKVSVQENNGTFSIKKQQLLNSALYVVSDSAAQKLIDDSAKKNYTLQLSGFDRILILTNGTLNVAKYANDTTLSTYTLNTLTKISDLKYKTFVKSNSCDLFKLGTSNVCQRCSSTDLLWKGKCYSKIQNCAYQVGSQCIVCNKLSIQSNGKCINDCGDIFA